MLIDFLHHDEPGCEGYFQFDFVRLKISCARCGKMVSLDLDTALAADKSNEMRRKEMARREAEYLAAIAAGATPSEAARKVGLIKE